jgi:5-formyltetrahydrofolate cyclo-ligase
MKPEASQKALKSRLRRKFREQRRNIAADEKLVMDSSINRFLADYVKQSSARSIAAFWPFDGEPDLLPTLGLLECEGIQIALPDISQAQANPPARPSMIFRQWTMGTAMELNIYGIPEPVGTGEILLTDIDLMLLPLVAWDESGGRLGMGAGFYDRALKPFNETNSPIRMGVAYQLQKMPFVPAEPWDIGLHMILSEAGCSTCPHGR